VLDVMGGNFGSEYHHFCFLDLVITGRTVQALVDLGASHKFLKTKVAKEMGLKVSSCGVAVKEVNSKEKEVADVASSFHIRLDKWEGRENFMVMHMDKRS
jgi:hypothetical protein